MAEGKSINIDTGSRTEIANVVAKKIIKEIFPRFGIPKIIGYDNGAAFVAQAVLPESSQRGLQSRYLSSLFYYQDSVLLSLTPAIMPRGQKSNARPHEKRRQVLKDAQAKEAEKAVSPAGSDQASGDAKPSTSTADFPQQSEISAPSSTASQGGSHGRSDKGDQGQGDRNEHSSRALPSTRSMQMDLMTRKTGMLMEYMLLKYKVQQPMKRREMLKVINKRFKKHFPEILKKASYRLDVVFGLELKEVLPHGQAYELVSKLDFEDDGSRSNELGVPTRGILIALLSVIYLNNYCAAEEDVWYFLNALGVDDGVPHLILIDVRKLITEDLVQEMYLVYRQVPNSDPPSYQFLWGPRAYAETSQIKVMDFLAKISEVLPVVCLSRYEQDLIEEEEEVQAAAAAKSGSKGNKGHTKTKLSCPTHK
ncbi:melanoma-associated antigen B2-like [Microtus oregoni]|uniref:melanoma-associated antigen B2-like n=1 Tax=Microtus oregoni TaxID=111838 RepID=UPI001BB278A3|nr:melanoma-associated antigen B2-like [Microtus oregoni]